MRASAILGELYPPSTPILALARHIGETADEPSYSAVAAALIGLLLPSLTMAQPDERYWGPGMMWGGGLFHMFNRKAPLPIMRQVQIAAGSLVLLGILLAVLASPWFMALSAFVGAGLIVAGIAGFCGMASLLRHMPWNRSRDVDTSGTPAAAAS